jgi:transposase-like protein
MEATHGGREIVATAGPRVRRHTTLEERSAWVRKYEESGKSPSEFCRGLGLAVSTFSLWRKQLRESAVGEAVTFSEVPHHLVETVLRANAPAAVPQGAVMVHLDSGKRVEVAAGTEVTWVARLVAALED